MQIEDIFKMIRTEETLLWIGAGFSRYAGYPTGWGLRDIILKQAIEEDRLLLEKCSTLKECAASFSTLYGRSVLEKLLVDTFSKKPDDVYYHTLLSHISHFDTIITTNYDQLIENSFTTKAVVIRDVTDINNYRIGQTKIFKIHGDITRPNGMIISTSDYSRMHNRLAKDAFWSSVYEKIASKNIIFLGYGYEDENIESDFIAIYNQIGSATKKRILISPKLDKIRSKRLKEHNIYHLERTGENFLEELIQNLKRYVITDMENGMVEETVALKFIHSFDLSVSTDGDKFGTKISNIYRKDRATVAKLEFKSSDPGTIKQYNDFLAGDGPLNLEIDAKNLIEFNHIVEGFHLNVFNDLAKFSIELNPVQKGKCEISFPSINHEKLKLNFKLYSFYNKSVKIVVEKYGFLITSKISPNEEGVKIDINLSPPANAVSVTKYRSIYYFLSQLLNGVEMDIRMKKGGRIIKHKMTDTTHAGDFKRLYRIYEGLLKIETRFGIKFRDARPSNIKTKEIEKINFLTFLMEHGYYAERIPEGFNLEINNTIQQEIDKFVDVAGTQLFLGKGSKAIDLLDQSLTLGEEQLIIPNIKSIDIIERNKLVSIIANDGILGYKFGEFGLEPYPTEKI
ncbi:SIR2 family protein [Pedobacter sp.]